MKPKFILTILMTLITVGAKADSFSIIRDGKDYVCTSTELRDPNAGIDCVNKAYAGPFSKDESVRLCTGAHNTIPAQCGLKAYNGPFNKEEAIDLCIRANSLESVDCALKAYAGPFSRSEAITLCKRNGTLANVECALKAYAGPYSREEAVRLCKNEPHLMVRSLNLMQQSAEIQRKVMTMKVNIPELSK